VVFESAVLGGLEVGRSVELEGYWEHDPEYGTQFRVERVVRADLPREEKALRRYLEHNIPGVGPRGAADLVRIYGPGVLAALRATPDLPCRIWRGARGQAASMGVQQWLREVAADHWSHEVAPQLMAAADVGYPLARRICNYFTSAEVADLIVRRDPYRLLEVPGIGWNTADRVAMSMGVSPTDESRLAGAVLWAFREEAAKGHSALPRSALRTAALRHVPGQSRNVGRVIAQLAVDGEILRDGGLLYQEESLMAECDVADLVRWLSGLHRSLGGEQKAMAAEVIASSDLKAEQAAAVWMALFHGVSVLTGRAGTGKTTTLRTILHACQRIGLPVRFAAPTGKAAARTSEVTGARAMTIHKLLGGPPGRERESGPIRDGLLVVEEASMLDLETFAWLARNIRPGPNFRLLFVGDENQLPSVGPGQLLSDLIASGVVPATRLVKIRRQAADSTIIRQAHRILDGESLALSEQKDFRFVELPTGADKAQAVVMRAVERVIEEERCSMLRRLDGKPFEPCRDFQVLTPRNSGALGVEKLHPLLGARLNPRPEPGPWIGGGSRARQGDRVICTENDYTVGVSGLMNGEQGVVASYERDRIHVDLDDGRSVVTRGVQNAILSLAFAVTVHKSQGSEYPVAVVVFHSSQYPLLDRRVLYTAITRARQRVILCADRRALLLAQDDSAITRTTGLAHRLRRKG
jgi:exodeoxyribonuclease V alpha subunit